MTANQWLIDCQYQFKTQTKYVKVLTKYRILMASTAHLFTASEYITVRGKASEKKCYIEGGGNKNYIDV